MELLMPTTRVQALMISSDVVEARLIAHGFDKNIAGADFGLAVKAIVAMFKTGRGLFVAGEAGCGKTRLLSALKSWLNKSSPLWFYCKDSEDMARLRELSSNNPEVANVYVDDIGSEEIIKEYGNTIDVVGDFVQRYHYRGKGRFFASTNLNSTSLNNLYGMRTLDRILEMCVVLKMNGATKRERIVIS